MFIKKIINLWLGKILFDYYTDIAINRVNICCMSIWLCGYEKLISL